MCSWRGHPGIPGKMTAPASRKESRLYEKRFQGFGRPSVLDFFARGDKRSSSVVPFGTTAGTRGPAVVAPGTTEDMDKRQDNMEEHDGAGTTLTTAASSARSTLQDAPLQDNNFCVYNKFCQSSRESSCPNSPEPPDIAPDEEIAPPTLTALANQQRRKSLALAQASSLGGGGGENGRYSPVPPGQQSQSSAPPTRGTPEDEEEQDSFPAVGVSVPGGATSSLFQASMRRGSRKTSMFYAVTK